VCSAIYVWVHVMHVFIPLSPILLCVFTGLFYDILHILWCFVEGWYKVRTDPTHCLPGRYSVLLLTYNPKNDWSQCYSILWCDMCLSQKWNNRLLIQVIVFWVMMPHIDVVGYQHFGRHSWTVGVLGFDSQWGLGIFSFTTVSRMALGPAQPPIQWVSGAFSWGVKWLAYETSRSPPSSAKVKECMELYLHSPDKPSWHGAQLKIKHRDNFALTLPCHYMVSQPRRSRLVCSSPWKSQVSH
jgi:hypothetical protein